MMRRTALGCLITVWMLVSALVFYWLALPLLASWIFQALRLPDADKFVPLFLLLGMFLAPVAAATGSAEFHRWLIGRWFKS
jgi:hypothetical protein